MSFGIFPKHLTENLQAWEPLLNAIADKENFVKGAYSVQNYTPTYSGNGAMTYAPVATYEAAFVVIEPVVVVHVFAEGTTGGVANTQLRFCLPIPSKRLLYTGFGWVSDGTGNNRAAIVQNESTEIVTCRKFDDSAFTLGNNRIINVTMVYFRD